MTETATLAGGPTRNAVATLAGGCFWCTEAIFKRLKGVTSVTPGYSGGDKENASYAKISSEDTKHAESINIEFDPKIISYEKLLEVFFALHDPTTINKQGSDVGTQYRSAIFYHNKQQKSSAEKSIKNLNEKVYSGKIVTELVPFEAFYEAEDYHKEYYEKNKNAPYCKGIIDPKIQKLYKNFERLVKD